MRGKKKKELNFIGAEERTFFHTKSLLMVF